MLVLPTGVERTGFGIVRKVIGNRNRPCGGLSRTEGARGRHHGGAVTVMRRRVDNRVWPISAPDSGTARAQNRAWRGARTKFDFRLFGRSRRQSVFRYLRFQLDRSEAFGGRSTETALTQKTQPRPGFAQGCSGLRAFPGRYEEGRRIRSRRPGSPRAISIWVGDRPQGAQRALAPARTCPHSALLRDFVDFDLGPYSPAPHQRPRCFERSIVFLQSVAGAGGTQNANGPPKARLRVSEAAWITSLWVIFGSKK